MSLGNGKVDNKISSSSKRFKVLSMLKNILSDVSKKNANSARERDVLSASNDIELERVIDENYGFQVNKNDMGEFYRTKLESGYFTENQIQNMLDIVNKRGYISNDAGNYYASLFEEPNYDIYVKTVYSSDVDSIMQEGLRCLGSFTSGCGLPPKTISEINMENVVTQVSSLHDLIVTLKSAIGFSQGLNPINGTIIVKIPKGMKISEIVYFNEVSGFFCIKPRFIACFSKVDENGVVSEPRFYDDGDEVLVVDCGVEDDFGKGFGR